MKKAVLHLTQCAIATVCTWLVLFPAPARAQTDSAVAPVEAKEPLKALRNLADLPNEGIYLMKDLYRSRHEGSDTGLSAFIDGALSAPVPPCAAVSSGGALAR